MIFLILAGIGCIAILIIGHWWPRLKLKRWRKALALDKHERALNEIYAPVNGFLLSKAARKSNDAFEYVYGEIDFESFVALLTLCKPDEKTCFYDLGSGTGKAVLAFTMVFDGYKSCGIELFSNLHYCAQTRQQRLSQLNDYRTKATHITFKHSDFLDVSFPDATLVFINATAFFAERWLQISRHIEQVKPGTLVISTSKALDSNLFITKTVTPVRMSWGVVNAYIQERSLGG
ncbi:MAG: methyltransferase domain-containing protein [Legionella sp.]|nr:methyltransferase domain-containing protein [Legionella sp.]